MENTMQPQYPQTPNKGHRKLIAILLLTVPTVLILLAFALTLLTSMAVTPTPTNSDLFGDQNTAQAGSNVVSFIFMMIGFITWLPGLIAGIILLATKKK